MIALVKLDDSTEMDDITGTLTFSVQIILNWTNSSLPNLRVWQTPPIRIRNSGIFLSNLTSYSIVIVL